MKKDHIPVMLKEVLRGLNVKSGGLYVDGTVGAAGYSEAILRAIGNSGRLIGFDLDQSVLEAARKKFSRLSHRVTFIHSNFSDIRPHLNALQLEAVDGIVVDLGVSSMQLDRAERGFSFQKKGPLDMRMDQSGDLTAEKLVSEAREVELQEWFRRYGEERFANRIAKAIVLARQQSSITTTTQLADIVWHAVPPATRHGKIHPATRAFQALRIVVNGELINLEHFLDVAPHLLKKGGRLVVVSFHSLEDRIVKHRFRALAQEKEAFKELTKKPLVPTEKEMRENARARSAKLRILERI